MTLKKFRSQNRKRSSQGLRYAEIYPEIELPPSQNRKQSSQGLSRTIKRYAQDVVMSQNRKQSSQGLSIYYVRSTVFHKGASQNRKRSSQGRGQAWKPAPQAAEKGIFEKQTNVFLPHK